MLGFWCHFKECIETDYNYSHVRTVVWVDTKSLGKSRLKNSVQNCYVQYWTDKSNNGDLMWTKSGVQHTIVVSNYLNFKSNKSPLPFSNKLFHQVLMRINKKNLESTFCLKLCWRLLYVHGTLNFLQYTCAVLYGIPIDLNTFRTIPQNVHSKQYVQYSAVVKNDKDLTSFAQHCTGKLFVLFSLFHSMTLKHAIKLYENILLENGKTGIKQQQHFPWKSAVYLQYVQ